MDRLAEVIVVLALRKAIAMGAAGRGLVAGLAHPQLHRAILAMHDAPQKVWRVESLATEAGMSRSHFMQQFRAVVGSTPNAYLTSWRLTVGRRALAKGEFVKSVARNVGFSSAAAFSRAFSRKYGHAPGDVCRLARADAGPLRSEWYDRIASVRGVQ